MKSFKVGPRPDEVVFNASGSTAYVTNINNASVGIINTATDVQTQTFPVLGAPLRVTLSRDESALYVTLDNGNLVVLNATTGAVSATLPVGTTPNGIALNPVSARLYVTATGTGMLTEVNTATNTVVRTIFVGGTPQDIVALPERNTLYIACESGFVDVRNLETGARTDSIPVTGAFRLALTPDAKQLWVTQSSRGRISVIDVASSDVIDVVETLGAPRHIAFSPGGAAALVANEAGVVQIVR